MTQLLIRTLRDAPQDAEVESHKLLARASYVFRLSSGVYNFLPLGQRVLEKLNAVIREHLNEAGAQELLMSVLQPVDLWDESGRSADFGGLLPAFLVKGRSGKYVMGPTHEEVATRIVSTYAKSYKDLPVTIYQIQTKFRDEARPRFGLLRTKELIMCDAYSFDVSKEKMTETYQVLRDAYDKIFETLELDVTAVEAKSGAIGGDVNHEYMVSSPIGEDTFVSCSNCGYSANTEIAKKKSYLKEEITVLTEKILSSYNSLSPQEIYTPGSGSIDDVSSQLDLSDKKEQFLKTYVLKDIDNDNIPVFLVVTGDRQIKIPDNLSPFDKADFDEHPSIINGFVSPYNIDSALKVRIICDYEVLNVPENGFVVGANKAEYHVKNVVPLKDFAIDAFEDIAVVNEGDSCPNCESPLNTVRSVEAAHTFQIGLKYSTSMANAEFLDEDGINKPYYMGCYGIGVSRLIAVIAETHHDDKGLIWPKSVSPFDIHIVPLFLNKDESVKLKAVELYNELSQKYDVLLDSLMLQYALGITSRKQFAL